MTGDVSLTLWHYLRGISSWVLPTRDNTFALGCTFESEHLEGTDVFTVTPWDGVGRSVIVRQVGLEAHVKSARILQLQFDGRKRWAKITLQNPSDKALQAKILVKGLWGDKYEALGNSLTAQNAELRFVVEFAPGQIGTIHIKEQK